MVEFDGVNYTVQGEVWPPINDLIPPLTTAAVSQVMTSRTTGGTSVLTHASCVPRWTCAH